MNSGERTSARHVGETAKEGVPNRKTVGTGRSGRGRIAKYLADHSPSHDTGITIVRGTAYPTPERVGGRRREWP